MILWNIIDTCPSTIPVKSPVAYVHYYPIQPMVCPFDHPFRQAPPTPEADAVRFEIPFFINTSNGELHAETFEQPRITPAFHSRQLLIASHGIMSIIYI
jgi:hypothetical protein